MKREFDPERHCGKPARQREGKPCLNPKGTCRFHERFIAARPLRPAEKHGMYSRHLADDEQAKLYDSTLAAIRTDEPSVVLEQLALEVATQAAAIERNGLPSDEAGQDALARKSSVIAKLVAAAAAARESSRPDEAPAVIQIANIANGPLSVRGAAGEMVTAIRGPNDTTLIQCSDGAWREAERFELRGVECWRIPLAIESGE